MKYSFDSIWLDMDGTLIDWSQGNVRDALLKIEDPYYYASLKPYSDNLIVYLNELKQMGVSLHVVSGIPDFVHCDNVPVLRYKEYYEVVRLCKEGTINRYFPNVFDSVDYLMQGESKAKFVKEKYNPKNPVFIDDMKEYIDQWRKEINGKALQVNDSFTCEFYLKTLLNIQRENYGLSA